MSKLGKYEWRTIWSIDLARWGSDIQIRYDGRNWRVRFVWRNLIDKSDKSFGEPEHLWLSTFSAEIQGAMLAAYPDIATPSI